jgi:hypothetical protein
MLVNDMEVFKTKAYDMQSVIFHVRKRPNLKAEVAMRLVEHFAIVAASEDGEDSAGRQAFKLQTPEQIVKRACDIASGLVDEFESRNWMVDIPPYIEIESIPK